MIHSLCYSAQQDDGCILGPPINMFVTARLAMNIYHERQQGNWCALHAINSLLQSPTYTFEDLVAISETLDEKERALMGSLTNITSQNMDNTGNFSIQVIIEALAPCGLELLPFMSSDPRAISARGNSCNEHAFLCHRNNHWFTIRKIGTTWYDLNSLLPFPQQIEVDGTHLYPFRNQDLIKSYTAIFIVTGNALQRFHLGNEPQSSFLEAEDEMAQTSDVIGKKRKKRKSSLGRKTSNARNLANYRINDTPEELEKRRSDISTRMLHKRKIESMEEVSSRRLENSIRTSNKRRNESEEKAVNRREMDAKRHRISFNSRTTSRKMYLDEFNSSLNGPLHEQKFTKDNMRAFHTELASFNQQHCRVCHELWPTKSPKDPNYTCVRCIKQKGAESFGIQNDMIRDLSSIPHEIRKLIREMTMIEEMLLSPLLPIMTVCRLASGANISRGFVANFRQDSVTLIRKIPLLPSQIPFLLIRRLGEQNTSQSFKVCRKRVELLGKFFVENHPGFVANSVSFCAAQCDLLPENAILVGIPEILDETQQSIPVDEGPMMRENLDPQDMDHGFVADYSISKLQKEQIANFFWPEINPEPVNEFEVSGMASLAFVKLFPLGQADPTSKCRKITVSERLASAHLLRYAESDPSVAPNEEYPNGVMYYPFAEHERFSFWMVDRIRRHRALSQSQVYLKQNPTIGVLTMEELKAMVTNGQIEEIISRMDVYAANVVGSDAYWSKKGRELEALVQQKEFGTAFFTMSFADNHWDDLHRLMPGPKLEPKQRYRNVLKNPHLADWYFSERLDIFFKHFFRATLDLEWFWYRFEWQSRTAIHVHGIVKLKNDPGIVDLVAKTYAGKLLEEEMMDSHFVSSLDQEQIEEIRYKITEGKAAEERVIAYADTLQTAINTRDDPIDPMNAVAPDPHPCSIDPTDLLENKEAMDQDYESLANCVQRHVCRPNGYCRNKETKLCRFHFPKVNQKETKITFSTICKDNVRADIVNARNDPFMNIHNRTMLQHWRANVDIQLILDSHAAMAYMVKYASKSEKCGSSLQSIIKSIVTKAEETDSIVSAIRSAVIKTVGHRDIGQGEASRILFSGNHCESTFKFVHVSLDLGVTQVTKDEQTGNFIEKFSLLQAFEQRHLLMQEKEFEGWDLDQPNFLEFARHFCIVKGQLERYPSPEKIIVITFPAVRYDPNSPKYVDFCRFAMVKYYPWTNAHRNLIFDDSKVVGAWEEFESTCPEHLRKFFSMDLELKRKLQETRDLVREMTTLGTDDVPDLRLLQWQMASAMRPVDEKSDPTVVTVDNQFDWVSNKQLQYSDQELKDAPNWVNDNTNKHFDSEQALRYIPVENDKQLLLIVNGTAGTGKSHTIAAISHAIPHNVLIRAAFTAKAAFIIKGSTLHLAFNLPVENGSKRFKPLTGRALKALQEKFKDVKIVIIDEYSMVSQPMLGKIDFRLREATGIAKPFGGISLNLVGDPGQLPPVAAPSLFSYSTQAFANEGFCAYRSFKKVITLKESCRQIVVPGDEPQSQFLQALNGIRGGTCSQEHWKYLCTRAPQRIANFQDNFKDAIHLYSTNEKVKDWNLKKLKDLKKPIVLMKAINHPKSARNLSSDFFRGLENEIFLAIGAQVTLTTNLNPQWGLTNGVKGTIVDIIFRDDSCPNKDQPSFLVVHFPDYIGPQFFQTRPEYNNYLPIASICISSDDFRFKRTQFPLCLSYALTIHKSQGQTLDKVVVDIGQKEITAGMTFVALSRVRHISNLAVMDFPYDRFKRIENSSLLKPRLDEEKRLEEISTETLNNFEMRNAL